MKTKTIFGALLVALVSLSSMTGCGKTSGKDKYDKNGRLILELQNLYFKQDFTGDDQYSQFLEEKFDVSFKPSNYSYTDWDKDVQIQMGNANLLDTVHFNLKSYNFGRTYEDWTNKRYIKALPEDLSKWPNLNKMINDISNVDALKIKDPDDGKLKLFGIPIANDISTPEKDFSHFTYVYRRDWLKDIDAKGLEKNPDTYKPLLHDDDVYTWEEFGKILEAFKAKVDEEKINGQLVLVDESWGFPSVTNFYKNVPHCFTYGKDGKVINAFTSEEYLEGLEVAKGYVTDKFYSQDQFDYDETVANAKYASGLAGILYDNFNLSNYITLRKAFKKNNKKVNLEDGTALMKVKGPDGKFALEGTENWFSMTMFNYDISQKKQEKILDILDYLLSEEGTRLAIYGLEGIDYSIDESTGEVTLLDGWEKIEGSDEYSPKTNGAKYLRYMATLGDDTKSYDPFTDMDAFNILNEWQDEMKAAKEAGNLRVVKEPGELSWMSTPQKNKNNKPLLDEANKIVLKYAFGKISDYVGEINKNVNWDRVLKEMNDKLGK